jgi:hypothetical protein
MPIMPLPHRIRQLGAGALLTALVGSSSTMAAAAPATETPISTAGDVEACDEDTIVVMLDRDNVYVEVETETGYEWQLEPDGYIGFGLVGGDVLTVVFVIPEAGSRLGSAKSLFYRVNGGPEKELHVADSLASFTIANPYAKYEFSWRLDTETSPFTPTTPDVVLEPSDVCPPPKLDDDGGEK